MTFDRIVSLLPRWLNFCESRFQFFIEQSTKLVKKLNSRNFYFLSDIDLSVLGGFVLCLFVDVVYELSEQMAHQVENAQGCDLVCGQGH